jgi:hypothetical protein
MNKQETLEEVLGSSNCEYSVIENKLAILYRNQVKIYDAITKEQDNNKYSEEEVEELLNKRSFDLIHKRDTKTTNEWFDKYKKK